MSGLNRFNDLGGSLLWHTTEIFAAESPCDWHIWAEFRGQEGSGDTRDDGKGS